MQRHASFPMRGSVVLFHVALLALALMVGTAQAQTIELPQEPYLPLNLALDAASAALAQCQTDGYRVSVAVVDRGGVLKVLLRDDGTGPATVFSSTRKAYTSANLGSSTQEFATLVAGNAEAEGLRQLDPQFLILGGGLPIVVNDVVVGGIGVGGAPSGQIDEVCAQAGIDAILGSDGTAAGEEATAEPTEEATEEATATPEVSDTETMTETEEITDTDTTTN
jgi:uncharacterized protein GlcG (DUF336 family)